MNATTADYLLFLCDKCRKIVTQPVYAWGEWVCSDCGGKIRYEDGEIGQTYKYEDFA